ncbi:MAG: right-handed parallel beta-helix repeat-containing protein [Candidatus Heimdallarchaeaceae archaeon]
MNERTKLCIFLTLMIIIVMFTASINASSTQIIYAEQAYQRTETKEFLYKTFDFIFSAPILIDSDDDFLFYGFPGEGTSADPYIIQDYVIDTDLDVGILIVNTTKDFIIQNCNVKSLTLSIMIQNAFFTNSIIRNNFLSDGDFYGLYVFDCSNLSVYNNTCLNTYIGISAFVSTNITITNNIASSSECGIHLYGTNKSKVMKNECTDNSQFGVNIKYSGYIEVSNNYINNCIESISFYGSDFAIISQNLCNNSRAGVIYWFSDNGTLEENTCSNCDIAMDIDHVYSTRIAKNICYSNYYGVLVSDTHFSEVVNNTSSDNEVEGLRIRQASSTSILNNVCVNNGQYGIKLSSGNHIFEHPIKVVNNFCKNSTYGIYLDHADSMLISNNTHVDNFRGIYLEESNYNAISYNIFMENSEYGVFIDEVSTWNKIHHNDFIKNNKEGTEYGKSQGFDDGFSTKWYDSSSNEGNYWSNHRCSDEYSIDGNAEKTDPYPFSEPIAYVPTDGANFNIIFIPISLLLIVRFIYRTNSNKTRSRKHL